MAEILEDTIPVEDLKVMHCLFPFLLAHVSESSPYNLYVLEESFIYSRFEAV